MSTEANKAIARRLVKAINEQNLAEIDAVFSPTLAQEWQRVTLPWLYRGDSRVVRQSQPDQTTWHHDHTSDNMNDRQADRGGIDALQREWS